MRQLDPAPPEIAAFVPSLDAIDESLRAAGEPEVLRVAALHVTANVYRRETWREVTTVPADAEYPAAHPEPKPFEQRSSRRIVRKIGPAGGAFWRVEIEQANDVVRTLVDTFVPRCIQAEPSLIAFESALESVAAPVEALRCHDLSPRSAMTAYRGARKEEVAPTFHGHEFDGTIELAKDALDRFLKRGRIVALEVRAYAWPLLVCRFPQWKSDAEPGRAAVVLFCDAEGATHVFVPDRGVERA